MSSTFHHLFDGYWLCLDLSSSCVEINCFVPRGKLPTAGSWVSGWHVKKAVSRPLHSWIWFCCLISKRSGSTEWITQMFLSRESVRELSRVLKTREFACVFDETPFFLNRYFESKNRQKKLGDEIVILIECTCNRPSQSHTQHFYPRQVPFVKKGYVCRMPQSDYFLQRSGRLMNRTIPHDKDHP